MNESLIPSGRLTVSPNPLPPGVSSAVIRWETVPALPAEVTVSDNGQPEKVVSAGANGRTEVGWICSGRLYEFHLYESGGERRRLASLCVRRSELAIEPLLAEVGSRLGAGELQSADLGKFVASLIKPQLNQPEAGALFRSWEADGFHVTPVGDDQPIPNLQDLTKDSVDKPQELLGFDLNPASQRNYLRVTFPAYREELEQIPMTHSKATDRSYLATGKYGGLDAALNYCMVRHLAPKRVLEIGGGQSTVLLRKAIHTTRRGYLICAEPAPEKFLLNRKTGPDELLCETMKTIDFARFTELEPGDILSVKTSHVVKSGSDVNRLFLEILPQIAYRRAGASR